MSSPLEPYTAVLVASYGGPDKSEDVLPFMRNATAGRGIPDERLVEVSQHYELFGGRSPINQLNAELMDALRAELAHRGIEVPVVIGNRNWHPFHAETVPALQEDGHRRVVALATAAYGSYSSCRQYHEDLEKAQDVVDGAVEIDKVGPFSHRGAYARAHARALADGVRRLRHQIGDGPLRVVFVTHSIPIAMNEVSGIKSGRGTYLTQHEAVASRVADLASRELGEELGWELTFCSRSGAPHIPWLEPDVNDRLPEIKAEGVAGVVASPIGFLSDHMEVIYDLDTQANETARDADLPYVRAATINTDPEFVSFLADLLLERAAVARGEASEDVERQHLCAEGCCVMQRRPSQP